MRINVYDEELGESVELIEQTSRQGTLYYGLRLWLHTAQPLLDHSTEDDDDRSAVTIWSAKTARLRQLVNDMLDAMERG